MSGVADKVKGTDERERKREGEGERGRGRGRGRSGGERERQGGRQYRRRGAIAGGDAFYKHCQILWCQRDLLPAPRDVLDVDGQ